MTQELTNPSGKADETTELEHDQSKARPEQPKLPREIGGAKGLEPTRYGDWEHNGRCSDF